MCRAEGDKGTSGSEDSRNKTLLPCPDGKIKPLPPIPTQASAENEYMKNLRNEQSRGSVPEQRERRENGERDRDSSDPEAPPRPDSLIDPKAGDDLGMSTLQRSRLLHMREKVEKWRERRSELVVSDRTQPESRRMSKLK